MNARHLLVALTLSVLIATLAQAETWQLRQGNSREQWVSAQLDAMAQQQALGDLHCTQTLHIDSTREHSDPETGVIAAATSLSLHAIRLDWLRQQYWCAWQQRSLERGVAVEKLRRYVPNLPVRLTQDSAVSLTQRAIEVLSALQVLAELPPAEQSQTLLRWSQGPHAALYQALTHAATRQLIAQLPLPSPTLAISAR